MDRRATWGEARPIQIRFQNSEFKRIGVDCGEDCRQGAIQGQIQGVEGRRGEGSRGEGIGRGGEARRGQFKLHFKIQNSKELCVP